MTKPLATGEKNRRANIRAMKAVGRKNAKMRARKVAANVAAHEARNEDRHLQAITARQERRAAGIAKRDAHNAALKGASSAKAAMYELAFNRPAAMGDGYGAMSIDLPLAA